MTITTEKILRKIKKENIIPSPRWMFVVRDGIFWCMFIISLLLGALSFAVLADLLLNHDWDIYFHLNKSFMQYVLLSIPYVWIISLLLFAWFACYDFVHIKGWYRCKVYVVVSISIIASLVMGIFFYYSGVGRQIDQILSDRIPFYHFVSLDKNWIWCNPHSGLLGGEIIDIKFDNGKMIVKDCHGNEWLIKKIMIHPNIFKIWAGEKIKIIGKELNVGEFEAVEFRSW